jgi:hypothetical protein
MLLRRTHRVRIGESGVLDVTGCPERLALPEAEEQSTTTRFGACSTPSVCQ